MQDILNNIDLCFFTPYVDLVVGLLPDPEHVPLSLNYDSATINMADEKNCILITGSFAD